MSEYAPRIRAARAYKGFTQEELAEELGVDVQTIKRREAGKQDPKRSERIAIAAICEVPLDFLENGFGGSYMLSDEQLRTAAELLGPQLLEAARALEPTSGKGRRVRGASGPPAASSATDDV